jgi:hypothetical protein
MFQKTVGATYNVQWGSQRLVDEAVVIESGWFRERHESLT